MNEQQAFERIVAESVNELGPLAATDGAIERTLSSVDQKRQRPRWLALIKEPPMRTNSHLAVGSPTVRAAAVLAATLLLMLALAAAGAGARTLLASDGDIVVAQDGSGDHTAIQAGVDAAEEGQRVLVHPGVYQEQVVIEKSIELVGDGGPGDVVVELVDDGTIEAWIEDIFGLNLLDNESVVVNLTVRAPAFDYQNEDALGMTPINVEGGAPTLSGLIVEGGVAHAMALGDTEATVTDVELHGGLEIYFGAPTIEASRLLCGVRLEGDAVLRNNTIRGDGDCLIDPEWGYPAHMDVYVTQGASPTLSGNDISMGGGGIVIWEEAISPVLDANRIHGNDVGISLAQGPTPIITNNELVGNGTAILLMGGSGLGPNAVIAGNTVTGGTEGIHINAGRSELTDNTVSGVSNQGVLISGEAAPLLRANSLCDNGEDLVVIDPASPDIDDSNEICEVAPAE